MDNTIIQQGSFTSTGEAEILEIRSDVDWMEVRNDTQFATTQTPGRGIKFEWQRGLAEGAAWEYLKTDATDVVNATKVLTGGFTLIPSTSVTLTGTSITKSDPAVCTVANHGFSNGDVVFLQELTNMPQISFPEFTIGNVTTNTFELSFFNTNTPNFVAETSFIVTKIPGSAAFNFRGSIISSVTKGTTTGIQLAANDAFPVVGNVVRLKVTDPFKMTELNDLQAEVLAINPTTSTVTIDVNSSSFTDFVWPSASDVPFTAAWIGVIGTENSSADNTAITNKDFIGMELGAGVNGPAGSTDDLIFWKAGKSFSVTNQ